MDILITGANGFLGRKITRRITEDTQFDVIAVARSKDKVQEMCVQEHIRILILMRHWSECSGISKNLRKEVNQRKALLDYLMTTM